MSCATASELERWRALEAPTVFSALAEHAKRDCSFVPLKDRRTSRWHVCAQHRDYELLVKGCKFFDTRAAKGGGGAVDLAMHLLMVDFASAVVALRAAGL